ncbi:MAG: PQQ-binding-like beta-propeller repeat protein [Deltaproteobacteria bacterium]|nr:PQQ-binding-like beta-propeller repeat protein [Deltaproteobacteria bacterium]
MRQLGASLVFAAGLALLPSPGHAQRKAVPPPIHPDTLPTLIQDWALPASLAPFVTNSHAPRMTRKGQTLYVYDHHGRRLVAANASSGKVLWHAPVPGRSDLAFAFTPFLGKAEVYVASDGYLCAFHGAKGTKLWDLGLKGVPVNGMARSKHHLYLPWIRVASGRGVPGVNVWAVDARNGRVEWTKRFPGMMAYLEGDADGAYYVADDGTVLALTPDRGDPRWQTRVTGRVEDPPILSGNRLYVSTVNRKAGWSGSALYALDLKKGKILWEQKLASPKVAKFLVDDQLVTVETDGRLSVFDAAGKRTTEILLAFGDAPTSLKLAAGDNRAYVFSSHPDGNGYVWLVDLEKKRVVATANALDLKARSMLPGDKVVYLDGEDGTVYTYRLDRSQRPRRPAFPPEEFAQDLIERAKGARTPQPGLVLKLAGLGVKAIKVMEAALEHANVFVVDAVAAAIAHLETKRSVPALLKALGRLRTVPPVGATDPMLSVVDALARLRDGKAVVPLQKLMEDETQGHHRRRAAYVALGAVGTPAALAPLWAFRAARQVNTIRFEPVGMTSSLEQGVEQDGDGDRSAEDARRRTAILGKGKGGAAFVAALSPFLGGYNDVWVGKADGTGGMAAPLFTGVTRPEVNAGQFLRLGAVQVGDKGQVTLTLQRLEGKSWVNDKPTPLSLEELAADSDGDGLPDLVERRLRLCVHHPDCDGDGLKDSEDGNPLASGKEKPTADQELFREAFFAYFAFLKRRGIVVVDPGDGPSFEVYGRRDPVISLRRSTIERLRKEAGLHAADYVSFGGPYPEGTGSGGALPKVVYDKKGKQATLGMDIVRSGDNGVAYNVTLQKSGKVWVVTRLARVWATQ